MDQPVCQMNVNRMITLLLDGSARGQMMLRGAQINYKPGKSYVIIIIINTQGQIMQINFIRKDC